MSSLRQTAACTDAPPVAPFEHDLGDTGETLGLLVDAFAACGDLFRAYAPARRSWTWVVSRPDDVKRVLVTNHRNYAKGVGIDRVRLLLGNGIMTSEGDRWRRQRRMMQPCFRRRVVERFDAIVREENAALLAEWSAAARAGVTVNVTDSLSQLTLRIILRAVFGDDGAGLVGHGLGQSFMLVARETRRDTRFAYEFRQLARHVRTLLRERCGRDEARPDFLQMLLAARDPDTCAPMTETEVVDEAMTLIVAGHETTANALNWTWWLLARHPAVADDVAAEQRSADDPERFAYANLDRLPRLHRVVDEALRLYPPGWLMTRRSLGPDRLGGHPLPPGTDVFISPYLLHRHPRHWPDPERFDPAHFDPAAVEARHAFAYIPFGAGPRHCIGQNLALYQMMLHLHGALRRFRPVALGPPAPRLEARINLRMAQDMHMRIEER